MRRLLLVAMFVLGAPAAAQADYDCGDFSTQAAAQSYFDGRGYTGSNDPERLDADSDGVACESNRCPCAVPGQTVVPVPQPACSDGTDNEADTKTDYPADPGCTDTADTDETDPLPPPPACSDGADNDADGKVDTGADPGCSSATDSDETDPVTPLNPAVAKTFAARVIKITDGDTVGVRLANGKNTSVRLLGIDTPETKKPGVKVECGGKQATAAIKKLALGKTVTLTTDPSQDQRDRYGRLLAYVTVTTTKADVALRLLQSGWAAPYVYDNSPVSRHADYLVAASTAHAAGKGVWGSCNGDFHSLQ